MAKRLGFRHCDSRMPFLWQSDAQPAARWRMISSWIASWAPMSTTTSLCCGSTRRRVRSAIPARCRTIAWLSEER